MMTLNRNEDGVLTVNFKLLASIVTVFTALCVVASPAIIGLYRITRLEQSFEELNVTVKEVRDYMIERRAIEKQAAMMSRKDTP